MVHDTIFFCVETQYFASPCIADHQFMRRKILRLYVNEYSTTNCLKINFNFN